MKYCLISLLIVTSSVSFADPVIKFAFGNPRISAHAAVDGQEKSTVWFGDNYSFGVEESIKHDIDLAASLGFTQVESELRDHYLRLEAKYKMPFIFTNLYSSAGLGAHYLHDQGNGHSAYSGLAGLGYACLANEQGLSLDFQVIYEKSFFATDFHEGESKVTGFSFNNFETVFALGYQL